MGTGRARLNARTLARLLLSALALAASTAQAALPHCPTGPGQPRIQRLIISSDVVDREPIDWLHRLPRSVRALHAFSELRDAAGTPLVHDWYVDGKLISRARLKVGHGRWRTWSRVASYRLKGDHLRVEATLGQQCLLATAELNLSEAPAIPPTPQPSTPPVTESSPSSATPSQPSADLSSPNGDHHQLERQARRAMLHGDFDAARGLLARTLSALPEDHEERPRLRDELYFHLPLLQLDAELYLRDLGAAETTLSGLINYLDSHPRRQELRRRLAEYAPRVARLRADANGG